MLNTTTCAAPLLRHRGSYSDRSLSAGSGSPARRTPRLWQMEEDLEITVFLTRHSHLSPHVSQRFQRSLPDLGRSLSQESSSSLAQPRLYCPHMPIHRIFAQEPFGTVDRGEKLRMICIRWRHKPLIPARSKHPCDMLTVRECFDKVSDNSRLYLCVVIQQDDRMFQCPLPLLSCGRPPFTLFRFRLFLSSRSRSGHFELFGHELIQMAASSVFRRSRSRRFRSVRTRASAALRSNET